MRGRGEGVRCWVARANGAGANGDRAVCSSGLGTAGDVCPIQGVGRWDLVVAAMGNMGMEVSMYFLLTNFFSLCF